MSNESTLIARGDPLSRIELKPSRDAPDHWPAHTLRSLEVGVIVTGLDARIRSMNPAAQQLTGWTIEEALGLAVGEVLRYRPAAGMQADLGNTATAEDPLEAIGRVLNQAHPAPLRRRGRHLVTRDRHERLVDEWAGLVTDDGGSRLGAVLVLQDASLRMAHEKLLSASEQRFRNAFDHAPLGMAVISPGGDFLLINDALCVLLGARREELKMTNHDALTLEDGLEAELQRRRQLLDNPAGALEFEKQYRRLDGRGPVSTLVSVCAMQVDAQTGCYLYQVHDLTEQKKAAVQLAELAAQRARLEADERASRAKREFISRASHEMRTPLNGVMGFAQLLQMQKTPDPSQTALYATQILQAGGRLLALVDDLLDIQRAAQGMKVPVLSRVDLAAAAEEMRHFLHNDAQAAQVQLDLQVPAGLQVMADPARLRQVLRSLGSNAVKFNRPGGSVRLRTEALVAGEVMLKIEDTGIGMAPDQMAQLFEPFDRLGRERSSAPGVGLGLLLARSLVLEMSGRLEAFSEVDRCTVIAVALRAAAD